MTNKPKVEERKIKPLGCNQCGKKLSECVCWHKGLSIKQIFRVQKHIDSATQRAREGEINFERVWAMPNKWTFTIKPIRELLKKEVSGVWIDPFAGENGKKYAKFTNDIAEGGVDALTYLKGLRGKYDGVLYDPPYSITQARQYGHKEFASMRYWKQIKDEMARLIKPGGKAICFGWSSQGLGKGRGFTLNRILLVPHGGSKNDTIVTIELKSPPKGGKK